MNFTEFYLQESITDNPQFMRWFKGSKIVDKNGNPLIVYHGSGKKFTEFRRVSNKGTFDPNSKDINEDNSIDNILKQFKNIPEIVRYDWDKVAFGFSVDDEIRININDLKVKYKDDLENAIYKIDNEKKFGRHFKDSFDDLPSIEVSYENGKFYIEDGHHRYYYAKKNNINNVKVKIVDIKENPIIKMGYNSIDDLIKRYKEIKDEL